MELQQGLLKAAVQAVRLSPARGGLLTVPCAGSLKMNWHQVLQGGMLQEISGTEEPQTTPETDGGVAQLPSNAIDPALPTHIKVIIFFMCY